jgi:hypothetical protein
MPEPFNFEKRMEALAMNLELQSYQSEAQDKRIAALTGNIEKVLTIVEGLAEIAKDHERRLNGLEGK